MVITKLINIHDGNMRTVQNGNFMFIGSYERVGMIIAAFLNQGWKLNYMIPQFTPGIQKGGNYSFYKDGYDCLFVKSVIDGSEDDSEQILEEICMEMEREIEATKPKIIKDDDMYDFDDSEDPELFIDFDDDYYLS